MRVSAQLYTVRQRGDLAAQLDLVASCGFTDVETVGFHGLSPNEVAACVTSSGFRVRSAHFDWEEFETCLEDIVALLGLLECPVAVMPWLTPKVRPDTAEGWRAVSGQLAEWADHLSSHGIRLAYHNHDFDLVGETGATPLDIVLEQENLSWQPDIGWLAVAGCDIARILDRFASRIVSAHIKDADPAAGIGDERWRDLGQGVIDWAPVLCALADSACTDLLVEHDETGNHRRTLETGRRFLMDQMAERCG